MNMFEVWAADWGIPTLAVDDLRQRLTWQSLPDNGIDGPEAGDLSEAAVQSRVRLEAGRRSDVMLWRNNVGAMEGTDGRVVRFGLANDSAAVNKRMKSADLIGIHRRVITAADVGATIGQFVSVEVKRHGWTPGKTPDQRTQAQTQWAALVQAYGGVATIYNGHPSYSALKNLPEGVAA